MISGKAGRAPSYWHHQMQRNLSGEKWHWHSLWVSETVIVQRFWPVGSFIHTVLLHPPWECQCLLQGESWCAHCKVKLHLKESNCKSTVVPLVFLYCSLWQEFLSKGPSAQTETHEQLLSPPRIEKLSVATNPCWDWKGNWKLKAPCIPLLREINQTDSTYD